MAKPTKYAFMLMRALKKLGVRFNAEVQNKNRYTDIVIPTSKINIEVDGRQHVTDYGQILNDLEKSRNAREKDYDTVHITNHDIYENVGGVASALAEASAVKEEKLSQTN